MRPYYEDDSVFIFHGSWEDVLPSLCSPTADDLAPDVVVTDPPYGIGWRRGDNTGAGCSAAHDGIANDENTEARDSLLAALPDVPAVVFGSFYAPPPVRVRQVLVWHKPGDSGVVGSTTGYRRDAEPIYLLDPWPSRSWKWSSVLRARDRFRGHAASEAGGHPHAKPVDLMHLLIDRGPDGLILDPFMGSGSTLRAAKDLGRKAVGIEVDERYCEVAAKRMGQEVLDLGGVA